MIASIGENLTEIIKWLGQVLSAVVTESGALSALMPVFTLGIAISITMLGAKVIKLFTWGA